MMVHRRRFVNWADMSMSAAVIFVPSQERGILPAQGSGRDALTPKSFSFDHRLESLFHFLSASRARPDQQCRRSKKTRLVKIKLAVRGVSL
jgi:hypothetical protein